MGSWQKRPNSALMSGASSFYAARTVRQSANAIYFLFRPQRAGIWVLFNALIAGAVQNVAMTTTVALMLCLYAPIGFIAYRKRRHFLATGNVAV
jgi:hypothetical protein